MDYILEILKISIPALIVFGTVYVMLKKHFEHQLYMQKLELNKQNKLQTVPMKMQAYERLALFLERIRIQNLLVRFENKELSNESLCQTLMLGVQQEFEHNMVQQIYISQKLWEIIQLAKNEVLHEISDVFNAEAFNEDRTSLRNYFLKSSYAGSDRAIETALQAIKSEVLLMF